MGNLVSSRDYAKRRGVSEAMISKYKAQGRLVMVDNLVDIEESDKLLASTLDPSRGGDRNGAGEEGEPQGGTYYDLRNREMRARVIKLELENQVTAGSLVSHEEVDRETFSRTRAAQRELLRVPEVCADLVPEEFKKPVQAAVETQIMQICEGLAAGAIRLDKAEMLKWLEAEAEHLRQELELEAASG